MSGVVVATVVFVAAACVNMREDWRTASRESIGTAPDPELVKAFVAGAAEGYRFTIDNPEDAAEVLI